METVVFRFYQELNDFLPAERRFRDVAYQYSAKTAVKDAIEAIGIPHVEVDLILADGESVDFSWTLSPGSRIAVYPVFESFDIARTTKLRPVALREVRFALDVHLGKLTKRLRLLGFDSMPPPSADDPTFAAFAKRERRVMLTRDRELLKRREITHGYWLRSTQAEAQTREVVRRFDLARAVRPFTRCTICNGLLQRHEDAAVDQRIPDAVRAFHQELYRCPQCGRIYWPGSHFTRLAAFVERMCEAPDAS